MILILFWACTGGGMGGTAETLRTDTSPPTLSPIGPLAGDYFVEPSAPVRAWIDDETSSAVFDSLNYGSVNTSTFLVYDDNGRAISGTVQVSLYSASGYTHAQNRYLATFTPAETLRARAVYTVRLTSGITDLFGNHAGAISWTFTGGPEMYGSWRPMSLTGGPARGNFNAFWTGQEMLVWDFYCMCGALYNPTTDSWRSMSSLNAPRAGTLVWTGTELIAWGGEYWQSQYKYLNTGARYNPATNTWTAMSTVGAPEKRGNHFAVWTGTEMIVWGGYNQDITNPNYLSSGGRYNPQSDTWTPISDSGSPFGCHSGTAVWTGSEMITFGGIYTTGGASAYCSSGGRYNPGTDSWSMLPSLNSPSARAGHTAVWTGTDMIIWGGYKYESYSYTNLTVYNTGARYNPVADSWTPTTLSNAPQARDGHVAFWTGSRMLIWGGYSPHYGGLYDPVSDTWTATTTIGAPEPTFANTGVWTGTEMIAWGAMNSSQSGAIYTPP